jgi:uncharacterized protein (DUF433 family)
MAIPASVDIGTLISKSPEVRGGRPVIAGTGTMVRTIIGLHKEGARAEEIAQRKYLTLAQVHAALAYYYANQQEIETDMAEYDAEYKQLEKAWRRTNSPDHT